MFTLLMEVSRLVQWNLEISLWAVWLRMVSKSDIELVEEGFFNSFLSISFSLLNQPKK